MIKFIRKYQLFILVVGGTLLMIVFLLQPILTRLSPSPLKSKVATLNDGTTFTRGDVMKANGTITLLRRANPRLLSPRNLGGIGLEDSTDSTSALHWLLLVDHAKNAGLIGEAGDGASWIQTIALQEATLQVVNESRSGITMTNEEAEARVQDLTGQITNYINQNAGAAAASMGGTMDDVYKALADARGVERMFLELKNLPSYSDVDAIANARDLFDSIAVNAVVIDSSIVAPSIPDPSDEDLQDFFDQYRSLKPSDDEYSIGYTQPARVQLGWITLDKNTFMNAVKVDRVELNKIWRLDRTTYPGDFALERINLERAFRDENATDMMVEADRIIRSAVLSATNGLPKNEGILELPDDWESRRPKLEEIAQRVSEKISEEFSVSLPTPEVNIIGDRWLNANNISTLPGFGSANYRIGSNTIPVYGLPQFFAEDFANTTGLAVQPLVPIVDHAATDQVGNRYYAMVLGVREAGPAEEIADVGRDQVMQDFKSVKGFELLRTRIEELRGVAAEQDDLAPAIELAMQMSGDSEPIQPGVFRNILVQRDRIQPGSLARYVDPRLNTDEFRQQVREDTKDLDPLATPEEVAANPIATAVALPKSRAIAIALVVAPRPLTMEEFRANARNAMLQTAQQEMIDSGIIENDPFSFDSLSTRYGLTMLKEDEEE